VQKKVQVQFLQTYRELFNKYWRYIIFYGGRDSGKSYHVALALLLRGREEKLRILCTREYQNSIKDSVHKLLCDLIEKYEFTDYVTTKESIICTLTGTEFLFKGLHNNVNEIKSTEGVDICWVEEAQSVTQASLDVLTPTIRKPGSQIIFTFNRITELDPVYVNYVQNPVDNTYVAKVNFDVLEEVGLLTDEIKLEMAKDERDPDLYAHKWLGEPLGQGDSAVIGRSRLLLAMKREIVGEGGYSVGVDVARLGKDRTVFWMRKGLKTIKFETYDKSKIPQLCDWLEEFLRPQLEELLAKANDGVEAYELKTFEEIKTQIPLKVDDTGVGGGVTDEMEKRGYDVIPINFGASAQDSDRYPNLISEAWFQFADLVDEAQLPYESDLLQELSCRQYGHDKQERRIIESKEQYKKRGFRSPDLADACIICYYNKKLLDSWDIDVV
jgi:phage terminase large subunit